MNPAVAASFFSVAMSFLAIIFAIVNRKRIARSLVRDYFGDPTSYMVVTDGKFYRVRGPFDTFYTIRFRDKTDCEQYAKQLANWHTDPFNHDGWRPA